MRILQKSLLSLLMIATIALSGCAKYRAQPLSKLATYTYKEQCIAFEHRVLNKWECKRYLDRDVIAKGYQPIHITLTNNTNKYLNFSQENISLECVSAEYVAQTVHTSTVGRVTSYGVASLFLWPFLIPAVVDGFGSSQANGKLDEDFSRKELYDQMLKPFSTINGLIFVPREKFYSTFTIKLIDANSQSQFSVSTSSPFFFSTTCEINHSKNIPTSSGTSPQTSYPRSTVTTAYSGRTKSLPARSHVTGYGETSKVTGRVRTNIVSGHYRGGKWINSYARS